MMTSTKWAAALLAILTGAAASGLQTTESPVAKVVVLLKNLQEKVKAEGKLEQISYNKYACWCEDTLAIKAADIKKAKSDIEQYLMTIEKLKSKIAVHKVEIKQLTKDIAINIKSQKEAEELRQKELADYLEQKEEMENALKALDAAIIVLTGAGEDKNKNRRNLRTLQQAQMLSTAADLRGVLQEPLVAQSISESDYDAVKRFVAHPQEFLPNRNEFSAAQTAHNPFGDYAPQSTVIQGILKGLKDSFTANLEKLIAGEAEKVKLFEELMATKKSEETTLTITLGTHEEDLTAATLLLSQTHTSYDLTVASLAADEKFFDETKKGCKAKAMQWGERSRLRTEELAGLNKAIEILSDESAFKSAYSTPVVGNTTFFQLRATRHHREVTSHSARLNAFGIIKSLATEANSIELAKIAVQVKTGGHFDAVIASIDQIIKVLRQEESDDIAHRDLCQNKQAANNDAMASLEHDIEKIQDAINRLKTQHGDLETAKTSIESEITADELSLKEQLDNRNDENKAFTKGVSDDMKAIKLIEQAIEVLRGFYSRNKLGEVFAQNATVVAPTVAPTPETFNDGNYGGASTATHGIVEILLMIKEDLEKEVGTARDVEGMNLKEYRAARKDFEASVEDSTAAKVHTEQQIAEFSGNIQELEALLADKHAALDTQKKIEQSLQLDCKWVADFFQSRRTKRKAEIDGLTQAKSYLLGAPKED